MTDTPTPDATSGPAGQSAPGTNILEQPTVPAEGSGHPGSAPMGPVPGRRRQLRLHRSQAERMLGGVAAGLADFFDVDPTVVRIGFVVLALVGGLAVPLYLAGWALIPDEESDLSLAEELLARERARRAW